MSLPNFTFNPYVKPYVGGIANELGQIVQAKTAQFYQNAEQDDVLGYQADTLRSKIGPFENDQLIASQALDRTREELEQRAKRGDYENMFREVKRSARKFAATAEPLLQNRAQYDAYLKQMADLKATGKIGDATYSGSIQHSVSNYKGYDPANPNSLFKGYLPTQDVSIPDKVNKFLGDNFKSDKSVNTVIDENTGLKIKITHENNDQPIMSNGKLLYYYPDGHYGTEVDSAEHGRGRTITGIELATRQYIKGDKEINNYRDTQTIIGNEASFNNEIEGAVHAEVEKLGYHTNERDIDFAPASWLIFNQNKVLEKQPFGSAAAVPSQNKFLSDAFSGYKYIPAEGKMRQGTEWLTLNSDGKYEKHFDQNGVQLKTEDYINKITNAHIGGGVGDYQTMRALGIRTEVVSPEEEAKQDKVFNEEITQMSKNRFLVQNGFKYQDSPKLQAAYLSANIGKWNSLNYKQETVNNYNESVKNFKIVEPTLWAKKNFAAIKEVGDIFVPTGQNGNSVLAQNLVGRRVAVLGSDGPLKIDMEGKTDINTLLEKAGNDGWVFEGSVDEGLLKINPAMDIPGSTSTMQFTKGTGADKKTTYLNVAVGIDPKTNKKPALGIMQKVGQAYLSSRGGRVPIGVGKSEFVVINVPGQENGSKNPMDGYISLKDDNGQEQNFFDKNGKDLGPVLTLNDWQEWFINQTGVKEEANSYLLNKQ